MKHTLLVPFLTATASAFPWVVDVHGVDSSLFRGHNKVRRQQVGTGAADPGKCPFNADHKGAAAYDEKFPYNGAKNGLPGKGQGGYQVPADGDTAHQFEAPGPNDIRGPCPGLNTAANHHFLSHDGITTFEELVDAQQNLYNVGYDLSVLLAALGLTLTDGDIVTEKLSIGCDATSRTSVNPLLTGSEPGLNGHNKFESDASLTRNDFFTHNGDNFSFNSTLFARMQDVAQGNFDRKAMAQYRAQRYDESKRENPNFYFGPLALLLYGASSFLYELMPNGNHGYKADLETISSFFGAKDNGDGTFSFTGNERIPDKWTNRKTPYTNNDVTNEIVAQYLLYPVLFGGNTAAGSFDALNFGAIVDGKIDQAISPTNTACLLYQLVTQSVPGYLNGILTPTVDALNFVAKKVAPQFENLGCPAPLTR